MNPRLRAAIERILAHGQDCLCPWCRPTWSPREGFEAGRIYERARLVVDLRQRLLESERTGATPIRQAGNDHLEAELAEHRGGIAFMRALVRELESRP